MKPMIIESILNEGIEINKNLINSNEDINGMVRIFVRVKGGTPKGETVNYSIDGDRVGDKNIIMSYNSQKETYGPFYDIFNKDMGNDKIFEKLKSTFDQIETGYHIALFGYGYSGSGKSYTLINKDVKDYGVLIRAVEYYLKKRWIVKIDSIVELYNNTYNRVSTTNYGIVNTVIDMMNDKDELIIKDKKISDEKGMVKIIEDIENLRKEKKRIKATINNPESSRGHLFITLNIGDKGKLTVCDMAGREDPLEIWSNSVIDLETGDLYGDLSGNSSMFIGSVPASDPNDKKIFKKKRLSNNEISIKNLNATYKNKIDIVDSSTITGRFLDSVTNEIDTNSIREELKKSTIGKNDKQKNAAANKICIDNNTIIKVKVGYKPLVKILDIIDTCKEAHYINETLNHMIYYFDGLKGIERNMKVGIYEKNNAGAFIYHPERIMFEMDYNKKKLIGMIPILEKIQGIKRDDKGNELTRSIKPPKYCLFACVRQEKQDKFLEASKKTLDYAVNLSKLPESRNPRGLKELRNTTESDDQRQNNIPHEPSYADVAKAIASDQAIKQNEINTEILNKKATGTQSNRKERGGKTIRIKKIKKENKTQKNKKRRRKTKPSTKSETLSNSPDVEPINSI